MSRVTTIHHVNLQVSDRERTRVWYEKVLDAEFLDRSPDLNKGQLQFRLGNGEIHTNDTKEPVQVSGVHFAVEIADWDEMIAHMDNLGIFYSKVQRQAPGTETSWGSREYTGNYYTYVRDPDGNTIELVHHPLGIEDAAGKTVDLHHDADSLTWTKRPEFDPSG